MHNAYICYLNYMVLHYLHTFYVLYTYLICLSNYEGQAKFFEEVETEITQ